MRVRDLFVATALTLGLLGCGAPDVDVRPRPCAPGDPECDPECAGVMGPQGCLSRSARLGDTCGSCALVDKICRFPDGEVRCRGDHYWVAKCAPGDPSCDPECAGAQGPAYCFAGSGGTANTCGDCKVVGKICSYFEADLRCSEDLRWRCYWAGGSSGGCPR